MGAGDKVLIMDNGGWQLKVGYSTQASPSILPNYMTKSKAERGKLFTCDEVDNIRDLSGLYYQLPFQKGFLVNWDIQRTVWDHVFTKKFNVDYSSTTLLVTEPHFNFTSIQNSMNEIFFEEYQFAALHRTTATSLAASKFYLDSGREKSCIVVDSGYSFTHVVPYINRHRFRPGVVRLEIGGKMLTNYLKDVISYRQLHVLDETHVMNQCKEDCCFVSTDFTRDMRVCQSSPAENTIARDYILPDYLEIRRGYIRGKDEARGDQQMIRLNNERFSIPELLFSPSDVGINQAGVAECVSVAANACDSIHRPDLFANIVLIGGNAAFPGFKQRVENEVRQNVNSLLGVGVHLAPNPSTYAWKGGQMVAQSADFASRVVTRKQYFEKGSHYCNEKFDVG